jgi:hypothetical protein
MGPYTEVGQLLECGNYGNPRLAVTEEELVRLEESFNQLMGGGVLHTFHTVLYIYIYIHTELSTT